MYTIYVYTYIYEYLYTIRLYLYESLNKIKGSSGERWGAVVETQKNVREEIGGWGREPFHENYAPSLSTIYDGA